MNSRTRKLLDLAKQIGWSLEGQTNGGHLNLRHRNGARYTCPSTPSDWRGIRNCLADLERIGGDRLPRVNKGRSRKSVRPSGFNIYSKPRPEALAACARINDLVAVHEAQRCEWESLIDNPSRDNARRARELLGEIRRTEADLAALHQPVEKIA